MNRRQQWLGRLGVMPGRGILEVDYAYTYQGHTQGGGGGGGGGGGVQGVQVNPPFFKLIIFIAWLGMHV